MKQIISFSGGKDSLATWIKLNGKIKKKNLIKPGLAECR